MSAEVVLLPGMPRCESCDCGIGRVYLDGHLVCEACADQLEAAPAPAQQRWFREGEYTGPSLEEVLNELTGEPG